MGKALAVAGISITLLLGACAATAPGRESAAITPQQAVMLAAANAPGTVSGVFDMHVKATGKKNGLIYLNSEDDYRDQRNVSVAVTPDAARQLAEKWGLALESIKGKHILVSGDAARTTIYFYSDGRRSDKYYYQTQIRVADAGQITMLN